ncbi:hypothetical protein ACWGDE_35040 [Streptomyces sp. NPDC054956]
MGTTQRFGSTAVEQAEAVLVEQYPRLVRLAYVTLPLSLGRHTRVLLAHKAVQRALPRAGRGAAGPDGPGGPSAEVRVRVLRASLAPSGRARAAAAALGWPPVPPFVWGLRLWPPAGGIDELAQALAGAPGPVRAAFVLHLVDGLPEEAVARLLGMAGVADPEDAVREALAATGRDTPGETLLRMLRSPAADPAVVSARPTDLLRRRRRTRAAAFAAVALAAAAGVLAADGSAPHPAAVAAAGAAAPLDPARLLRVPAEAWADTARVDFTAWPARGGRVADRGLLARALAAWAARPREVAVTAAPGTAIDPPGHAPQLLFAGDVAGRAVVVLLDGDRVARYAEAPDGPGGRELAFARTDGADVTTAAALTLTRSAPDGTGAGGRARYLLAPWIAKAATLDLVRPGDGARPLAVSADGVTEETAAPDADGIPVGGGGGGAGPGGGPAADRGAGAACGARPVLELTSSPRIVEGHAFLLADLGALTPVHLTYTPLPDGPSAVPARRPREATGPAARAAWAPAACRLPELGGGAVRAVNIWDFADSELPDGAGRAVWSCTRASGWAGPGDVLVQLRPSAGPPQDVARARSTAACGRFGQHLLAGTRWRSPAGRWYLLAAGSREVAAITVDGPVRAETAGRDLAVPVPGPQGPSPVLTARLASGARITAVDGGAGGRD